MGWAEKGVCMLTATLAAVIISGQFTIPPPKTPKPDLGINANMKGYRPFPNDNPWNQRVDHLPVDPNSNTLIASIGLLDRLHPDFGANWNGGPFGIPYVVVSGKQRRVPIVFDVDDESDPGPYPIPPNAPIEGGPASTGDRHILVIDRDNLMLYETFSTYPNGSGGWTAYSGAIHDLKRNHFRPHRWTSADAAGLPIFPGLVRYDEVVLLGEVNHAFRFTANVTRRAYVHPARHWASSNTSPNVPPMGMRVRLKSSFDISSFPPHAQVILRALKRYGMILADNGSDWFISGAPDPRWDDNQLNTLKNLRGQDFEVVQMGQIFTP
jgi:hypothetical protein